MDMDSINQGGAEFAFWADLYKFRRFYYNPVDDERFWESMINSASIIAKKYENSSFAKTGFVTKMLVLIMQDIQKKYNMNKDKQNN